MRLDKNTALRLSEPVEDAYLACLDRLVVNIAKHLGTGKAFRTAAWETMKLAEQGQLTEENARIINAETKKVPAEIRKAIDEASALALESLEKAIQEAIAEGRLEQAPVDSVKDMLQELQQQAVDSANLVNTVMLESGKSAYLAAIENTIMWQEQALNTEVAQAALNDAASATLIGSETRRQALQKAISQMADSGIYGFVDRAGRHWSPEAYINMDIRTTVHNAAIQSIRNRQQDYNSDIFQVSTHPGARPLCFPYQGKFYTWGSDSGTFTDGDGARHSYRPVSTTSYGQAAGLFGINCGHVPYPQIPGVTIPRDDVEQSKEENDRAYRETQQQRALERSVRDAKRKAAAFETAGLDDAFAQQAVVVKQRQAQYDAFCKETGRKKRVDRTQVAGYNRSVSGKVNAAVKRAEKAKVANQESEKKKKAEIRERIRSDETQKQLNSGNQNKHIVGSKGYQEGRSYIYGDLRTAQDIVNQRAGTGEIRLNDHGEWNKKEFVTLDHDIGVYINPQSGERYSTNTVSIHYGKKGTHVVPARRKDQ